MSRPFKVTQLSRTVHEVSFNKIHAGWETHGMLRSDAHNDSAHNDWELEREHLDRIKNQNGFIIDAGDVFDLMQGKYDPRKDYSALKEEHKGQDYLDKVVGDVAKKYKPYADNFCVIGMGNHEYSILDRLGTNVTDRLAREITSLAKADGSKSRVYGGGYSGWIIFRFNIQKTVKRNIALHYYHGSGGGAPVTRGVISTNRMAVYLPDADIVMSGHDHNQWVVPIPRVRISKQSGTIASDFQYHVKTGSYKDERGDGHSGWAMTKADGSPKNMGACWLRFYLQDTKRGVIGMEFTPALPAPEVIG